MISKIIQFIALALLMVGVVAAQEVSLRSDHPDEYVVVKGDTLWGISGRFLDKPWQWPAIWQANPQIENPHLIYPGDVVSLVYVDGVPQLRLSRGGDPADRAGIPGTVRLSPKARVVDKDDPINAIPLEAIKPFIRDVRILSPAEFAGLPYILANEDEHISSTVTDTTFARGLNAQVGTEWAVVRLSSIYDRLKEDGPIRRVLPQQHWKKVQNVENENLGLWGETLPGDHSAKNPVAYELVEVSRVRVIQSGEISSLQVIEDLTEVRAGDYILPIDTMGYDATFFPHAMSNMPSNLEILATKDSLYGVGHNQIVSLNGGTAQGLEPGQVFSVYRPGTEVNDRTGYRYGSFAKASKPELPAQFHALVMVFRTFENISYAMVMSGDNVVRAFDQLRPPSERM
ncbi:MAG: LysM peptidoglycan-binding domain-containing protein [Xanthomonadales bacterium]|nr:LysM peptidoglycan-binding domain-containing protein [Xanthomonadales bacterium]